MPRPRARIDLAYDAKLVERGLTVPERAKIHGVDASTLRRALERGETPAPLPTRPAPDPVPGPSLAELTPDERRRRALATIDAAMAEGGAPALRAAGLAIDDVRRAVATAAYVTDEARTARLHRREQARRLGVALRVHIDAGDAELAELYRAAASTLALPEHVAALATWIDTHPEVLHAAEIA